MSWQFSFFDAICGIRSRWTTVFYALSLSSYHSLEVNNTRAPEFHALKFRLSVVMLSFCPFRLCVQVASCSSRVNLILCEAHSVSVIIKSECPLSLIVLSL